MNITELLQETAREVDAAGLDQPLRVVAFEKVLAAKLVGTGASGGLAPGTPATGDTSDAGDELGRVAQRLSLPVEAVGDVFHTDESGVGIGVPAGKLDTAVARATKQIALLVAGSRQAAGTDDGWTKVSVIRDWCREYNRLDTSNFAATVQAMENVFTFRGRGADRAVRLTRPGWDEARALVAKLAGVEI